MLLIWMQEFLALASSYITDFVSLSDCVSVCPFVHLSVSQCVCLYICHSFLPLSPQAKGVLSLPVSVCPSVHLPICLYDQTCPCDNSKIIFQMFLNLGWNILWVNILDKFDDGYYSSINMCIIDQKVTLTSF